MSTRPRAFPKQDNIAKHQAFGRTNGTLSKRMSDGYPNISWICLSFSFTFQRLLCYLQGSSDTHLTSQWYIGLLCSATAAHHAGQGLTMRQRDGRGHRDSPSRGQMPNMKQLEMLVWY